MSKKAPKPEPKTTTETPTKPSSEKSDIRIFVALCR